MTVPPGPIVPGPPMDLSILLPYLQAGMRGLALSRWRPGDDPRDLVAPIVLQVLLAVSRDVMP